MLKVAKPFTIQTLFIILVLPTLLFVSACTSARAQGTAGDSTIFLPVNMTPEIDLGLSIQSDFGEIGTHRVITDGIFAIWWHPDYDQTDDYNLTQEAVSLAAALNDVRRDSLSELGLQDPPNLAAGAYVNIYIHDPETSSTDQFPNWWGNGVGTNQSGVPYMTLPLGAHVDPINVAHEGFHIFQYSATNEGYEYAGDSAWYIEASANWYAVHKFHEVSDGAFVEAAIIKNLPFVTIWRSWDNAAPGDPQNWQREVHQYAMHTWLFFLTEINGVDIDIMTAGYYADTGETPQEYMYRRIPNLRELFGDWTAANVSEFSYLTRPQWVRAQEEVMYVADPTDLFPTVATLGQTGTNGEWFSPPAAQTPRGWSYNVIEMNLTESGPVTVNFEADSTGSQGAQAYFESRIVVKSDDGFRTIDMPLQNGLTGEMTVETLEGDEILYVILAAVPEHFGGVQTYGYQINILN